MTKKGTRSPLAHDVIESLQTEPVRWRAHEMFDALKRDDGVCIWRDGSAAFGKREFDFEEVDQAAVREAVETFEAGALRNPPEDEDTKG